MKYTYVGEGLGVPGLPHEISDEEAKAQGMSDLLAEAVRNGTYVPANGTEATGKKAKGKADAEQKS